MISFQTLKQVVSRMFPNSDVALRQEFDGTVHAVVIHRFNQMDLIQDVVSSLKRLAPAAIPVLSGVRKPHRWASAPYNRRRRNA
jgi:hypothetical protein